MLNIPITSFHSAKVEDPQRAISEFFQVTKAKSKHHMPRVFHRGERLFGDQDAFEYLYILVSGSAKSYVISENGDEHITNFLMPGDLIGHEGFDTRQHAYIVSFLETSSVISIPLASLTRELAHSSELTLSLLKLMSHSIKKAHKMQLMLSNLDSEQRLASFLVDLSDRFADMGFSGREFNLSMSRIDIAKHLGMTIETVSRLFKRLQQRGIIEVKRRQVRIVDPNGLPELLRSSDSARLDFLHHFTESSALAS